MSGKKGTLNGRFRSGNFLRSCIIARLAQKRTNKYPALEIKLRKSTTPITAIKQPLMPTNRIETQGVRKRLSFENIAGQVPSRLRVKPSRVALNMDELTEVRVAITPPNTITGTPQPGKNRTTESVSAVVEAASSFHETVPRVTKAVKVLIIVTNVKLIRIPRGILRSGSVISSASSAMTSNPIYAT